MLSVSARQLRAVSDAVARRHANELRRTVDGGVAPGGQREAPAERLRVLRDLVLAQCEAIPGAGGHLGPELDLCATLLRSELRRGAGYNEARAQAHLYAAAALGAMWFVDSRLLALDSLPPLDAGAAGMPSLLEQDLSGPFRRAAQRAEARFPALSFGLRRALDEGCSPESLRALCDTAFDGAREPFDYFMHAERRLLQRADGIAPAAHPACIAGDLAFGMGRCVRWAARRVAGTAPEAQSKALTEMLHGLALPAH